MVDDLRPDLGTYGNPVAKTPNIDALARSGAVFERAFVSQAVCGPSRAALLTGKRPSTTGIIDHDRTVNDSAPDAVTLLDTFKAGGYTTVGIGKIYHHRTDDADGWSEPHKEARAPKIDTFAASTARWPDRETLLDTRATKLAVADMARLKDSGTPFFLAVGIRHPHLPFIAPQEDWNKYSPSTLPRPINPEGQKGNYAWSFVQGEIGAYADLAGLGRNLPASKATELQWGYLAAVSYVDGLVGELLAGLKANGLEDNTIVVLWGDHGFKLGDHGYWAKHSNADIDIRIPLIVRAPGWTSPNTRVSGIVESVDIYPTLAAITGLSTPDDLEGLSFAQLLYWPTRAWKEAAFAQYQREAAYTKGLGYLTGKTVRTDRYRYTAWIDTAGQVRGQELYDLQTDRSETTNVARDPNYADAVTALEKLRVDGWKVVRRRVS